MTAEVSVLNSVGVALAADSAVSIGSEADKIWTSADKLFHLSKSAPVGIMVYGNANFVGIPWETIVKEFRRELADSRYDYLEQYANSFFRFLGRSRALFPLKSQDEKIKDLILYLFFHIRNLLEDKLTEEAKQKGDLAEKDIATIIDKAVSSHLNHIRKIPTLKGFGKKTNTDARKRFVSTVRRARTDVFGKLPMRSATKQKMTTLAQEMIVRRYFGPANSGVVLAGFGEREAMPSLFEYQIEEMVMNRPRKFFLKEEHITLQTRAVIAPFAQRETVNLFLNGVDDVLDKYMQDSTASLFAGAISSIIDEVGKVDNNLKNKLNAVVGPEVQRALGKLFEDWNSKKRYFWRPILEITASLPKDELAGMAEALVNLTKFRRRITPERETVGGPIDVAVITKGDGFVWIKRKHYFDPSLNTRVIARYAREG